MPEYLFECVTTGEVVEMYMPVEKAVEIGKVVRRKGRRLRRIASLASTMIEPDFAHTSYQFKDDLAAQFAPRVVDDGVGGKAARFNNRREIEQTQAKFKAAGFEYSYDFGPFGKNKGRKL